MDAPNPSGRCSSCGLALSSKRSIGGNASFLIGRALIGIGGAFGIVMIGSWIGKISLDGTVKNQLIIISTCVIAGTISHTILPMIGAKLEAEFLKKTATEAKETASNAVSMTQKVRSYSAGLSLAETALSGKTNIDVSRAIEGLEEIKDSFPTDRTLYIYLGRLYRKAKDYDKAIIVLREFIANLEKAPGGIKENEKRIQDCSDAYYNIACYHALKAKDADDVGKCPADVERLKGEAIDMLNVSVGLWSKNREYAKHDDDFVYVMNDERMRKIVDT